MDPADGTLEFIGEDVIDHTPKDETVLIKLGEAFDVRAFHDFILSLGSVPLDVLSEETENWISGQQEKD